MRQRNIADIVLDIIEKGGEWKHALRKGDESRMVGCLQEASNLSGELERAGALMVIERWNKSHPLPPTSGLSPLAAFADFLRTTDGGLAK